MWLGRIELRLAVADSQRVLTLQRRPLESAFLLTWLHGPEAQQSRRNLDGLLRAFVGEPDDMTPEQMTLMLSSSGIQTPAELAARSDAELLQALIAGNYGVARIIGQILEGGLYQTAHPPRSFLLFGQRYTPDSQVLSNVVHDRVGNGQILRSMPSTFDVAFAALRNNQAAALLQPELDRYGYAPDLAAMRVLLDGHGEDYWTSNLYTSWLGALRALSPDAASKSPGAYGLPSVAGTEAWGRRLLNTQLASWAELRHDTVLYAKPAYGSHILCEFPDAYVDPYPRFYAAVAALADRGASSLQALSAPVAVIGQAVDYFEQLAQVARMLEEMAEFQRAHRRFTDAHMAFINEMVWAAACWEPSAPGWYFKLLWNRRTADDFDPTIADVYTSAEGNVLHAGTGHARLVIMTADTCKGARAYFGLVSTYSEVTTDNFQRIDDETWSKQIKWTPPADGAWMRDLIGQ